MTLESIEKARILSANPNVVSFGFEFTNLILLFLRLFAQILCILQKRAIVLEEKIIAKVKKISICKEMGKIDALICKYGCLKSPANFG